MRRLPPRIRPPRLVTQRLSPATHDEKRGTSSQRGYGAAWRRLREMVLNEEPLCRDCLRRGLVTPATLVDHIQPLRDGGTNERANLAPLCVACHARKTAEDVAKRKRM
jgi:5-methylcytosine-specific restriction protein A